MLHDFQTAKASLKRVGKINKEISEKKWFKAINQIDPKKERIESKVWVTFKKGLKKTELHNNLTSQKEVFNWFGFKKEYLWA